MLKTLFVATALASSVAFAQPSIPIRTLAPATARSALAVGSIASVREIRIVDGLQELPDGRVLINDQLRRQLVLFDASLAKRTVLADSGRESGTKYPPGRPSLISYVGDSVLLLDPSTRSLLVIDPSGKMGGVMALPRPQDFNYILNNGGWSDARGGILYTAFLGYPATIRRLPATPAGGAPPPPCAGIDWSKSDSATLLRADVNSRRVDTVGKFRAQRGLQAQGTLDRSGKLVCAQEPLYAGGFSSDAWIATSDGAVAIVRGHDYHIDWINPDGTRESGSKMAFDWRKLTDDDKDARVVSAKKLIDSLKTAGYTSELRYCTTEGGGSDVEVSTSADAVRGAAIAPLPPMRSDFLACQTLPIAFEFAPLALMPDYIPPVRPGSLTADRDGNVWILPTTSLAATQGGGLVYDVVNRRNGLVERVRIPAGRQIAGFGRGGTVYLTWRDATGGWLVERTRIVR
jgi:hypothetical protein